MSEGGFHAHGPHDHALEHAAHQGSTDRFAGRIAVTTAVLATVGAMFAYQAGATQAEAALAKNNAAIAKTEAANQWAYYQSKSNKENIAELGAVIAPPPQAARYQGDVERYKLEKAQIKTDAEGLETKSKQWDESSEALMHRHHRWAQATTAIQIAIALSAIALLTRRRWLQWGVYAVSAFGIALGLAAVAHL
jgi:uncharacterized protein DUF4337